MITGAVITVAFATAILLFIICGGNAGDDD